MPSAAQARSLAAVSDDPLAQFPFRFDVVPIAKMFVDKSYQRNLTSLQRTIEEKFNPALIQTLALSERGNGKYAVIDGQTRMVSCEKLGLEALPACVFTGLSREQEAELFELLDTQRRALNAFDRWKSSLTAKNPESLAINKLVGSIGLEVGPNYPGQIVAIGALRSCYRKEPMQLERTLVNLNEAFPDQAPAADLIKGMHLFFTPRNKRLASARIAVEDTRLVPKLQAAGLDKIRRGALAQRDAAGVAQNSPRYMARAIAVINGERDPRD